jgi:hypothetical protein
MPATHPGRRPDSHQQKFFFTFEVRGSRGRSLVGHHPRPGRLRRQFDQQVRVERAARLTMRGPMASPDIEVPEPHQQLECTERERSSCGRAPRAEAYREISPYRPQRAVYPASRFVRRKTAVMTTDNVRVVPARRSCSGLSGPREPWLHVEAAMCVLDGEGLTRRHIAPRQWPSPASLHPYPPPEKRVS